jgi:hypothetical protein
MLSIFTPLYAVFTASVQYTLTKYMYSHMPLQILETCKYYGKLSPLLLYYNKSMVSFNFIANNLTLTFKNMIGNSRILHSHSTENIFMEKQKMF